MEAHEFYDSSEDISDKKEALSTEVFNNYLSSMWEFMNLVLKIAFYNLHNNNKTNTEASEKYDTLLEQYCDPTDPEFSARI